MTDIEAKEILKLYRPGTADAEDPSFAEALALCERNAELKDWFARHCAVYSALRAKFKQIPIPEGLKEQIISERKAHMVPLWQKAVLASGVLAVIALVVWQVQMKWSPPEPHGFAAYRTYMISEASRGYAMDVYATDLQQIHKYLEQTNAIADYDLPANLQKNAKVAGCVAETWQGNRVSMICFQTKPMPPTKADLWLFVTADSSAPDTPTNAKPKFETVNGVITANWTEGGKTYVLGLKGGDEKTLSQYL